MTGDKTPSSLTEQRSGKQFGSEALTSECRDLDPKVEKSEAYQKAKKAFGPSAHEVQWGPDVFSSYTDLNNPFYYRTPKGMLETPAHVPQNPINLELHLRSERQRLAGMTPAEREWRKKYVEDQDLHPDEPFFIQEAQMQLNPLRRLYRWPLDTFARKFLYPKFGIKLGYKIRQRVPKHLIFYSIIGLIYYHVKYDHQTWEDFHRSSTMTPNPAFAKRDEIEALYPGLLQKAYPQYEKSTDFMDLGYSKRKIYMDVGETKRPW